METRTLRVQAVLRSSPEIGLFSEEFENKKAKRSGLIYPLVTVDKSPCHSLTSEPKGKDDGQKLFSPERSRDDVQGVGSDKNREN